MKMRKIGPYPQGVPREASGKHKSTAADQRGDEVIQRRWESTQARAPEAGPPGSASAPPPASFLLYRTEITAVFTSQYYSQYY